MNERTHARRGLAGQRGPAGAAEERARGAVGLLALVVAVGCAGRGNVYPCTHPWPSPTITIRDTGAPLIPAIPGVRGRPAAARKALVRVILHNPGTPAVHAVLACGANGERHAVAADVGPSSELEILFAVGTSLTTATTFGCELLRATSLEEPSGGALATSPARHGEHE